MPPPLEKKRKFKIWQKPKIKIIYQVLKVQTVISNSCHIYGGPGLNVFWMKLNYCQFLSPATKVDHRLSGTCVIFEEKIQNVRILKKTYGNLYWITIGLPTKQQHSKAKWLALRAFPTFSV